MTNSIPSPVTEKKSFLKAAFLHFIIAATLITAVNGFVISKKFQGTRLKSDLVKMNQEKADWILVGNSLARSNVDVEMISAKFKNKTSRFFEEGLYSAHWYLSVKNIVSKLDKKPSLVMIIFRDRDLTEPLYGITNNRETHLNAVSEKNEEVLDEKVWRPSQGMLQNYLYHALPFVYARQSVRLSIYTRSKEIGSMATLALIQKTDDDIGEMLETAMTPVLDGSGELPSELPFEEQVERSLLPDILDLLHAQKITPVFIRSKNEKYVSAQQSESMAAYMRELEKYLKQNDAYLFDYHDMPAIKASDFAGRDHLNPKGKKIFTEMLIKDLKKIHAPK